MRQFGQRQGLSRGSREYARAIRERFQWGPMLPYDQALVEFWTLQVRPCHMRPEIVDAGVIEEYMQYHSAHPIPCISDPAKSIPSFEDDKR